MEPEIRSLTCLPHNATGPDGNLGPLLGDLARLLAGDTDYHFTLSMGGRRLVLTVRDEGNALPGDLPAPSGKAPKGGTKAYREIYAAAGTTPIVTKALIAKAGYRVNAFSRGVVTELCRSGNLVRTPDGLVTGRPVGTDEEGGGNGTP